MSTESQVMALLEEGNPAIEITDSTWSGMTAAAYLATLQQRSSEMTQLDVKPDEATPPNRTRVWVAAAVAIVILGTVLVLASRDDNQTIATDPTPSTVAEAVPTTEASSPSTTTAPQPSTTIDAEEAAWLAQTPWIADGSGDFRTNTFGIPFAFSTGGIEWSAQTQAADWMYIQSDFGGLDFFPLDVSVEEAVVEWTQMHESFENASMTEPVAATVGSADGVRFETVGLPRNTADVADPSLVLFHANDGGVPAGPAGLVYVVDVAGQTVVIAFNDDIFDPEPGEIETAAATAQILIDTIVWKSLQ